ncbi:ABC transporter ATP-binding protein [Bauldia sp.]|uniref:ABC transporter ATP-binding protein n=1 Tax=Bauldia sp. TaxID=2575872 RepID=UPI003BA9E935
MPDIASDGSDHQFLRFVDVKKSYDHKHLVVKGFDLDVAKSEFVTLLGPSGSGKTTILMMLAGFESVTGGDIRIDGRPVTRTPPYKRNIGMVFQNYALFPHMTVAENLAYPLKVRSRTRREIGETVERYLALVELDGYGQRHPGQLSGGQRQRVALARAMIFEPSLVLMDEPLGALDKKLREQMQFEITQLHRKLGFTVIYVTHDQTEALTMSDRIAVFNEGVVQQCATPDDLYERPQNAFVADFIGENNFIPGRIVEVRGNSIRVAITGNQQVTAQAADIQEVGAECIVSVRPEKMFIRSNDQVEGNEITAKFVVHHYVGDFIRYYFKLEDGSEITVKVLNDVTAPSFADGESARLFWQSNDCYAFRHM